MNSNEKDIFLKFLESFDSYKEVESYWNMYFDKITSEYGGGKHWQPWLNTNFSDGTQFLDGNPIFSSINRELGVAIKIIQYEFEAEEGVFVDSWHKLIDQEYEPIKMFVIDCSITSDRKGRVESEIKSWLDSIYL